MGTITNIVIFLFCTSIFAQVVGPSIGVPSQSIVADLISGDLSGVESFLNTQVITLPDGTKLLNVLGVGIITAVAMAFSALFFPNPYAIFGPLVITLTIFLTTLPYKLFLLNSDYSTGVPEIYKLIFVGLFGVTIIFSMIAWYKGSGEL